MPVNFCKSPLSLALFFSVASLAHVECRDKLDKLPPNSRDLSFGNAVYKIRFEERHHRPIFGHRYWFYLKDAVDDVPEYIVHWDHFVKYVYYLLRAYRVEIDLLFIFVGWRQSIRCILCI